MSESNNSSKWEMMKCGIPQTSILGPLFFLYYINDLSKTIKIIILNFLQMIPVL